MQDFHEIIEAKLADRVISGDIPKAEEIKNISDQSIVNILKKVTSVNVRPKNLNSFMVNLSAANKLKLVIKSMFEKEKKNV